MAKRPDVPDATAREVLRKAMHRCSICYQEQVIIHHIDENPENNDESNLVVICLHHHGLAHTRFEMTRNLTPALLKDYKREWEQRVLDGGGNLPLPVRDSAAFNLYRAYERQQAALRIVVAEELAANYLLAKVGYNGVGGRNASPNEIVPTGNVPLLQTQRWKTLTDLGHLEEYARILARTYSAIDRYNFDLNSGQPVNQVPGQTTFVGRRSRREIADMNLNVGTAIAMSLGPLLLSMEEEPVDVFEDFGDRKFVIEFPQARTH
jgi:hypothetical protein